MLTDLVLPTILNIPHSFAPTAADGVSAVYLHTVQTEQISSDKSVGSHSSSALYRQKHTGTLPSLTLSSTYIIIAAVSSNEESTSHNTQGQ